MQSKEKHIFYGLGTKVTNIADNSRIINIIGIARNNEGIQENNGDFIYFSSSDILEKLEIDNLYKDDEFVINFETREVISLMGVEYEGVRYYTQYNSNIPNGQALIEYTQNVQTISYDYEVQIFGLNANIVISNISVSNATLSYKEQSETTWTTYTNHTVASEEYSIPIIKSGIYEVNLENKDGDSLIETNIQVLLNNAPKLQDGLTPVDSSGNTVDSNSGSWYNYTVGR